MRSWPSTSVPVSVRPPKLTLTWRSGCGNSQGLPRESHESGTSTWRSSSKVCRKMPYS